MKENWFEIAWINNDEAILHGHKADVSIRVTLTYCRRLHPLTLTGAKIMRYPNIIAVDDVIRGAKEKTL